MRRNEEDLEKNALFPNEPNPKNGQSPARKSFFCKTNPASNVPWVSAFLRHRSIQPSGFSGLRSASYFDFCVTARSTLVSLRGLSLLRRLRRSTFSDSRILGFSNSFPGVPEVEKQ